MQCSAVPWSEVGLLGGWGVVLTSVSALAVAITLHPSSTSTTTSAARTSTQRQLSAGCG